MGQGQADVARSLLHECARSGDWLCLKNLHLAVSWLPTLEKEVRCIFVGGWVDLGVGVGVFLTTKAGLLCLFLAIFQL